MAFGKRNQYIFAKPKKSTIVFRVLGVIAIVAAVVLAVLFIYFNFFGTASRIHIIDPPQVEINSNVSSEDLIEKIDKNGKIVSGKKIDTSNLGEAECKVIVDFDGKEREHQFKVDVVDTTAPKIECEDEITAIRGSTIKLKQYAKASDNSGEKVSVKIDGGFNSKVAGKYKIKFTAEDSSGNKAEKKVILNVINPENAKGDVSFVTSKGFNANLKDGVLTVDGNVIANKSFMLPPKYGPGLKPETLKAFNEMSRDASKEGIRLYRGTGFISYSRQSGYYRQYAHILGRNRVDDFMAWQGASDSQTGYGIDVNKSAGVHIPVEDYLKHPEAKWISENCSKYGFVIRYPEKAKKYTGFEYMPWHVRYVGKETAEILYNDGKWKSLEEYYGIPSEYSSGTN